MNDHERTLALFFGAVGFSACLGVMVGIVNENREYSHAQGRAEVNAEIRSSLEVLAGVDCPPPLNPSDRTVTFLSQAEIGSVAFMRCDDGRANQQCGYPNAVYVPLSNPVIQK